MPTPTKNAENSSKHRTAKEQETRAMAEQSVRPKRAKIKMRKPKLVSQDKAANGYWNAIMKEIESAGVELVDNLDSEVLAGYCSMLAMRDRLALLAPKLMNSCEDLLETAVNEGMDNATIKELSDTIRTCSALSKSRMQLDTSILAYAEKMGLTPSGRSRLAVKRAKADEADADPLSQLISFPGGLSIG